MLEKAENILFAVYSHICNYRSYQGKFAMNTLWTYCKADLLLINIFPTSLLYFSQYVLGSYDLSSSIEYTHNLNTKLIICNYIAQR